MINSVPIAVAWLIGMANPSPMFPVWPPCAEPMVKIAELTPMIRARPSTSGPPELPGLIGASVWIASMYAVGESASLPAFTTTGRWRAETMPWVTVPGRPSGDADRHHRLADLGTRGVAHLDRVQRAGRLDLDHRDVIARAPAEQLGRLPPAVGEDHPDGRAVSRSGDDVIVGDDPALGVQHESRSGAPAHLDHHRARQHLLGDRHGVEARAAAGSRRRRRLSRRVVGRRALGGASWPADRPDRIARPAAHRRTRHHRR